ncbi:MULTISPECIES: hypothetical protein [Nostoc]|uniref:Uncharacterized protein n=1 Tax=Nostoc paludosum FACHB-159 TaxID=2692908 RepID=A0ABR8KB91_9NOSO|nr:MULTISPECIES: hypothetical protein [Nostoc]MBD2680410.1 hypothetical protein [Nostoc sp. FACHB-857]MBD2736798.1 hypothetical protein [Nostoc paludosum FACHB-159]
MPSVRVASRREVEVSRSPKSKIQNRYTYANYWDVVNSLIEVIAIAIKT